MFSRQLQVLLGSGTPILQSLSALQRQGDEPDWRAVADEYPGTRVLVGELWLPEVDRFVAYLRPDELHTAFNFEFLSCPWDAARLRACVDGTLEAGPTQTGFRVRAVIPTPVADGPDTAAAVPQLAP